VWVHERQHTGQTMSQVMAAFRERFNKSPPRRATLLDWEKIGRCTATSRPLCTWLWLLCQVHCICKTFSGLTVLHTSRVGLSLWQIWPSCSNPRTRVSDCNFVKLLAEPCATFAPACFVLVEFSGEYLCYSLFRSLSTSMSSLALTFEVMCDLIRSACLFLDGLQAILKELLYST
jgi:hypothetical protein